MPSLTRNESIQTIKGDTITILDYIAEGGQGEVYKVDYKGQKYALKWYKAPVPPQVFYDNLAKNVDRGAPNEHYLWPIMLTKPYKNSYGYIMELRKPEFHEFSEFLLSQAKFLSYEVMLSAALNIVESFRLLHSLGFSYQDVNEGSFFINPNDGDVLICDNDNVAPNLVNLGVRGMPRYMAPEVVIDATRPNAQTDRFSLAVLLFRLFYIDHPLEGKYTNNLPMMDSTGAHMYGVSPVFCYDPTNEKNRPDPEAQPNVIRRWNMFPPDLQMTFIRAFTNGLKNPNDRITENEWEEALIRTRAMLVRLNGREQFVNCYAKQKIPEGCRIIKFDDYPAIVADGSKLYLCQVDGKSVDHDTVAAVIRASLSDKSVLGIGNLTDSVWKLSVDGHETEIGKNGFARLARGEKIVFNGVKATVL